MSVSNWLTLIVTITITTACGSPQTGDENDLARLQAAFGTLSEEQTACYGGLWFVESPSVDLPFSYVVVNRISAQCGDRHCRSLCFVHDGAVRGGRLLRDGLDLTVEIPLRTPADPTGLAEWCPAHWGGAEVSIDLQSSPDSYSCSPTTSACEQLSCTLPNGTSFVLSSHPTNRLDSFIGIDEDPGETIEGLIQVDGSTEDWRERLEAEGFEFRTEGEHPTEGYAIATFSAERGIVIRALRHPFVMQFEGSRPMYQEEEQE